MLEVQVFAAPPRSACKCIVATNIAETSITIPGVVVNMGKSKEKRYLAGSTGGRALTRDIAQSNTLQRAWRAGHEGRARNLALHPRAGDAAAALEAEGCSLVTPDAFVRTAIDDETYTCFHWEVPGDPRAPSSHLLVCSSPFLCRVTLFPASKNTRNRPQSRHSDPFTRSSSRAGTRAFEVGDRIESSLPVALLAKKTVLLMSTQLRCLRRDYKALCSDSRSRRNPPTILGRVVSRRSHYTLRLRSEYHRQLPCRSASVPDDALGVHFTYDAFGRRSHHIILCRTNNSRHDPRRPCMRPCSRQAASASPAALTEKLTAGSRASKYVPMTAKQLSSRNAAATTPSQRPMEPVIPAQIVPSPSLISRTTSSPTRPPGSPFSTPKLSLGGRVSGSGMGQPSISAPRARIPSAVAMPPPASPSARSVSTKARHSRLGHPTA
ncbi:hypothetical protein B0H11DRAFT_2220213 [Mycena galericulata]|nr:hypothetical protein B0H11DRAFT_2220213 [Mycena galericulata]